MRSQNYSHLTLNHSSVSGYFHRVGRPRKIMHKTVTIIPNMMMFIINFSFLLLVDDKVSNRLFLLITPICADLTKWGKFLEIFGNFILRTTNYRKARIIGLGVIFGLLVLFSGARGRSTRIVGVTRYICIQTVSYSERNGEIILRRYIPFAVNLFLGVTDDPLSRSTSHSQ